MLKSLKYRLRPTKKQEKILLAHIEECRLLYNQLVCAKVQAWEKNKKSLSRYEQQATLPMLKQQRKCFLIKEKIANRFPRYKGQNRYDSITYPQFSKMPTGR